MHLGKIHLVAKVKRLRELDIRFAREANDKIASEGEAGDELARRRNDIAIQGRVIHAAHTLERGVAS